MIRVAALPIYYVCSSFESLASIIAYDHHLFQVFCRDRIISTSPVFLRFLGFGDDAEAIYLKSRAEYSKGVQGVDVRYNGYS